MIRVVITLFFLMNYLHGDIEKYFQKITDKEGYHSFHNIDYVYIINLDERPEKLESCLNQLTPYGVFPYRFSAVNGWKLSLDTINHIGVELTSTMETGRWATTYEIPDRGQVEELMTHIGRNYFCHCMPLGSIGIVLSHLSVLQDAYDSGYNLIWVMEDDIEVIQDPNIIPNLIEKLTMIVGEENWDILFTDPDTKDKKGEYVICLSHAWRPNFTPLNPERFAEREIISSEFRRVGARYGAYSMIIKKSGMEKILNFLKKYRIFLPYDMEYYLPPDIKLYTVLEDVVSTQPCALSDNGKPGYRQ